MDVLVVDDDEDIRVVLELFLRGRGHDVTAVGDGAAARAACRERRFDAMLTDITLPDEDGTEVAAALAEEGRLPPVLVLLSATRRADLDELGDGLGAMTVPKPFSLAELEAALGDVLPQA